VVDVGNDRNIANIVTCFQDLSSFRFQALPLFSLKKTATEVTVIG
jgi:hypothetical protein